MTPRPPLAALAALVSAGLGCSVIAGLSDYHHAQGGGGTGTSTSNTGGGGGLAAGHPGVWPDSASAACLDDDGLSFTATCTDKTKPSYGQDGTFGIHKPSYDDMGDWAADSITGLTWMTFTLDPVTFADAPSKCEGSVLGGLTWRLPTRMELVSLLDTGSYNPDLDQSVWPSLNHGDVWSASPGPDGTGWVVNLATGDLWAAPTSETHAQLCVTGTPFSGQIAAVDAETALDARTGLTWQRATAKDAYTWTEALFYCEKQNGTAKGDEKGWRLPTFKELLTIVDETGTTAIDTTIFPNTDMARPYWSSTPNVEYEGTVYYVSFTDGGTERAPTDNHYAVRCVKSSF